MRKSIVIIWLSEDFVIQFFDEYIHQGELQKREKGYAWQTAIGLQAVDGLTPSDYLLDAD